MTDRTPDLDADGYPTEETLRTIREWPIGGNADVQALILHCREAWRWEEYISFHGKPDIRDSYYVFHTGGWSGNESIISALQDNTMFWLLCWLRSERGGHYRFLVCPLRETE